jgi:hypothetical protein
MQKQGASLVARFTVIEASGDEAPGLQAITVGQRVPGQEPMSCPAVLLTEMGQVLRSMMTLLGRGQHCNLRSAFRAL